MARIQFTGTRWEVVPGQITTEYGHVDGVVTAAVRYAQDVGEEVAVTDEDVPVDDPQDDASYRQPFRGRLRRDNPQTMSAQAARSSDALIVQSARAVSLPAIYTALAWRTDAIAGMISEHGIDAVWADAMNAIRNLNGYAPRSRLTPPNEMTVAPETVEVQSPDINAEAVPVAADSPEVSITIEAGNSTATRPLHYTFTPRRTISDIVRNIDIS